MKEQVTLKTSRLWYINQIPSRSSTYDHRLRKLGHPVRSAILKTQIGKLVVEWVTISESLLLYVFNFLLLLCWWVTMSKWAMGFAIPISCAEPRLSKAGFILLFTAFRFMQSLSIRSSYLYHDDC